MREYPDALEQALYEREMAQDHFIEQTEEDKVLETKHWDEWRKMQTKIAIKAAQQTYDDLLNAGCNVAYWWPEGRPV